MGSTTDEVRTPIVGGVVPLSPVLPAKKAADLRVNCPASLWDSSSKSHGYQSNKGGERDAHREMEEQKVDGVCGSEKGGKQGKMGYFGKWGYL